MEEDDGPLYIPYQEDDDYNDDMFGDTEFPPNTILG
jgi:hypothetical protein